MTNYHLNDKAHSFFKISCTTITNICDTYINYNNFICDQFYHSKYNIYEMVLKIFYFI